MLLFNTRDKHATAWRSQLESIENRLSDLQIGVCVICTREERRLTVNGNGTDFWFSSTVHTRSSSAGCAVVTVGFGLIERTKTVKVNHGRAEAVAEWNEADAGASWDSDWDCDCEIESESGCARESRTWHHVSNGSSSSSACGAQHWGEGEVGVVWWGEGGKVNSRRLLLACLSKQHTQISDANYSNCCDSDFPAKIGRNQVVRRLRQRSWRQQLRSCE